MFYIEYGYIQLNTDGTPTYILYAILLIYLIKTPSPKKIVILCSNTNRLTEWLKRKLVIFNNDRTNYLYNILYRLHCTISIFDTLHNILKQYFQQQRRSKYTLRFICSLLVLCVHPECFQILLWNCNYILRIL